MYVLNVIIDHVVEVYYKLKSCRRRIGKSGIEINFGSFWSGKYLKALLLKYFKNSKKTWQIAFFDQINKYGIETSSFY